MAKGIVNNETGSRQSKKSDLTFTLTLTESQWHLFWRLLTVGCGMSDDLLELAEGSDNTVNPSGAKLWQRLSDEFAIVMRDGEVERIKQVMDELTTH